MNLPLNIALTLLGMITAQVGSAALPSIDIAYEKFTLQNGLTLLVHEDHSAPIVAVHIRYHVGSKDEQLGRTGFAHLFEHLMFNGSEHYNDEHFRVLQNAGAKDINGATYFDWTEYHQTVPTSALDLALWLESDRMGHLLGVVDQKKLDEQRGVVQNEMRQSQNQPLGKLEEIIATNLYPRGYPYSWSPIGSMEDLNAASLEDVQRWFRTYYGAANAVLVVAGDVRADDVKAKVEHYFGDIAPGPMLQRHEAWVPDLDGEKRMTIQDRLPHEALFKVWTVPGYGTRDNTHLQLVAVQLANDTNTRLYQRLVVKDQLASAVSMSVSGLEISGQAVITVFVRPGVSLPSVERALEDELAKYSRTGPTVDELERVKMAFFSGTARSLESVSRKAQTLVQSQIYTGSPEAYQAHFDAIRDATVEQLRDAARRWLTRPALVLEIVPMPSYAAAKGGADRRHLPPVETAPAMAFPALQRTRLANGLEVLFHQRRNAPVVQMSLLADAGYVAEDADKAGIASVTMQMLRRGTQKFSANDFVDQADRLGVGIDTDASTETLTIRMSALSENLSDSLGLYREMIMRPSFPEEELARLKSEALAALKQELASPNGVAWRLLPPLLYGANHPYTRIAGAATEESISSLTTADLHAFYQKWVRPDNARLLVVGNTSLDELKKALEHHFSGWKAPNIARPQKSIAAPVLPGSPRVFLVDWPGASQSVILAASAAPARSDPEIAALRVANDIFGGSFTSRLNMNLREDKHWAYGASSGLVSAKSQGMFSIQTSVQTDATARALSEILSEAKAIRERRPPTEEEIRSAANHIVLAMPFNNATSQDVMASYAEVLALDLPETYLSSLMKDIQALDTNRLRGAVRRLVQPDALTWIVVGDLAQIEGEIRRLDIGEVKVLETNGHVLR